MGGFYPQSRCGDMPLTIIGPHATEMRQPRGVHTVAIAIAQSIGNSSPQPAPGRRAIYVAAVSTNACPPP